MNAESGQSVNLREKSTVSMFSFTFPQMTQSGRSLPLRGALSFRGYKGHRTKLSIESSDWALKTKNNIDSYQHRGLSNSNEI